LKKLENIVILLLLSQSVIRGKTQMNVESIKSVTAETPAQEVRFRCPHCQKLFCSQADVFDGTEPVFDCTSCTKSFLLTREVNEFGLFQTSTLNQGQFISCLKCSNLKPLKSDECPTCGILVSKYEELQKVESPYLFELNQIWIKVLADFTDEEAHQKFINACHKKLALNFAFTKYSELKKSLGHDLACEHYMTQVNLRLEQQFKADEANYYNSVSRHLLSRAQMIFLGIGLVGVALLIFNKIRPTFPNLTGLVVAITILSFGLVFFSAENRHIKLD
jgi:hypothetical protein